MATFLLKRHTLLCGAAASCWTLAVHAQTQNTPDLRAPLVGLIANSAHTSLRPIQGVPGASTVGEPVALPQGVGRVYVAPGQQGALVEMRRGAMLGWMPLSSGQPGIVSPINGAMAAPDLVRFGSNGNNAVLVSQSSGLLQVLTRTVGAPQIAWQSDTSLLNIAEAVVSDEGSVAALRTTAGEVYSVTASGAPKPILRLETPAAIRFLPGGTSLAVLGGGAPRVIVFDSLDGQPSTRVTVAIPALAGASGLLETSADGQSVILGATGGRTAYRIDLGSQTVRSLDLPVSLSRMDRLSGNQFLISANPHEAAWILMADDPDMKVGFAQLVPPLQRTPVVAGNGAAVR